jgi:hypothetical protein
MTFVGDHANILEDGYEHWNQALSPVAISSKWFSSDSCRIHSISPDASTRATFGLRTENGTPREFFQSQLFLKNFLNRRHTRQEVLRKYSDTGKRILLRKCRKLRPKVIGGRLVRGPSLQNKSLFLNFWSQILIWDRPHASTPSVVMSSWWIFWVQFFTYKYLMNNLCSAFSIYFANTHCKPDKFRIISLIL